MSDRTPQIDASTPVFVLRQSFAPLQHAVLGVARTLGRLGVPVYATRMSGHEPATLSRYIRGGPVARDDEQLLEQLQELGERLGNPVLLAIDDESAVFVGDHQDELAERFLIPAPPAGVQRRLASKRELWELCGRLGIAAPDARFPQSADEALEMADSYGYPVVLKRADPWLPPADPGAPSVAIARSESEVARSYRQMESSVAPQVMVQEYIPGGSETVWMFNGYFDSHSRCLFASSGRKLRQRGPHTGPTTLGECVWNEEVADSAVRLLGALAYRGIVDMGFRHDARDGSYKLLDVNPRMGSSFRLFAGEDGLDVVRAAYLDLTGQQVPESHARDGRRWLVEPYDLVASAQLMGNRALDLRTWARSLRAIDEGAWWAADDPVPFRAMCASLGREGWRYRRRRRTVRGSAAAQATVDGFFDSAAGYWADVYGSAGLQGLVYRERMHAALRWIGELSLPERPAALELGCGGGLLAVALAQRGLTVTAVDSSPEMVARARTRAERAGLNGGLRIAEADAHALEFEDRQFDLVVALGLLPWATDAERVVGEMARVLRPGGWLIVTADNRARLNYLTEPRENMVLRPLKLGRRAVRRARGRDPQGAQSRLHRPGEVDAMLRLAGLEPTRRTSIGFGPFTFLGRSALPDEAGRAVHARLETLSRGRVPALRRRGWHYLVAAHKVGAWAPD